MTWAVIKLSEFTFDAQRRVAEVASEFTNESLVAAQVLLAHRQQFVILASDPGHLVIWTMAPRRRCWCYQDRSIRRGSRSSFTVPVSVSQRRHRCNWKPSALIHHFIIIIVNIRRRSRIDAVTWKIQVNTEEEEEEENKVRKSPYSPRNNNNLRHKTGIRPTMFISESFKSM